MELPLWKRLFVWVVVLPGLLLTLFFLGWTAWPALAFFAILVLLVRLSGRDMRARIC
ncbi:MAG: hypothetical protein GXO73_02595 [Calditrichaeota bacterium]|nr:hypothetical protein [Calditrichota bacterium]